MMSKIDLQKILNADDDIITSEEGLIFNPFNSLNKEITLNDVQSILEKYNIPSKVTNIELYKRAFVHRSYTKRPSFENLKQNITIVEKPEDCLPLSSKSNERLEFLGDGVLELVTKFYLYRRFPKENEGFMTEKKIAIVKNESIGKFAYDMQLNKWLKISKHAEEKKIRTNLKKLGCLFEAFIGAMFLDFNKIIIKDDDNWFEDIFVKGEGFQTGIGYQMCQKFIESVFEQHIDWVQLLKVDNNYKNILQVRIQKEFKVTPNYLEIFYNPDEGYNMGVYLCIGDSIHTIEKENAIDLKEYDTFDKINKYVEENGRILLLLGKGLHKIKRKAEQLACQTALNVLYNNSYTD